MVPPPRTLTLPLLALAACLQAAHAQATGMGKYVLEEGAPPALQSDVLEVDPDTTILRPVEYLRRGDDFIVPGSGKELPSTAWVQLLADWVEPLTTVEGKLPQMKTDEMLLMETFGYVSITKPGVKATRNKPVTANLGDTIPSGSELASRESASAAILIGGNVSVRLGENTTASIGHRVVGEAGPEQVRTTTVELSSGYVFCKIGHAQLGGQSRFSVRTPLGRVVAEGTDFVVFLQDKRLVVGVAKGTVVLQDTSGKAVATATSEKKTSLRVVHLPAMADPIKRMTADSEFLTRLLDFIPQINLKVKMLRKKLQAGTPLSAQEDAYLERIPKVSYLRRVKKL